MTDAFLPQPPGRLSRSAVLEDETVLAEMRSATLLDHGAEG